MRRSLTYSSLLTAIFAVLSLVVAAAPAQAATYAGRIYPGDVGARVRCVQYGLRIAFPWTSTELKIDGVYGPITRGWVDVMKAGHGLPRDGVVGKNLGDVLYARLATKGTGAWVPNEGKQLGNIVVGQCYSYLPTTW